MTELRIPDDPQDVIAFVERTDRTFWNVRSGESCVLACFLVDLGAPDVFVSTTDYRSTPYREAVYYVLPDWAQRFILASKISPNRIDGRMNKESVINLLRGEQQMKYAIRTYGTLGWYDCTTEVLMQFNIYTLSANWQSVAAQLTYEHLYDATFSYARQFHQITKIVDATTLDEIVSFDVQGHVTNDKTTHP